MLTEHKANAERGAHVTGRLGVGGQSHGGPQNFMTPGLTRSCCEVMTPQHYRYTGAVGCYLNYPRTAYGSFHVKSTQKIPYPHRFE